MRKLKKVSKIIFVILLVGTLIVTSAENARATGAEGVVEIVGGSIAAGGIGAALTTICPPAMIIVGLIMVGQGIDIALTEASEAEGKTKLEFIQSKFEDFCEYTKQDFERTCNTIAMGAKILENGAVVLGMECTRVIAQFLANMQETGQIIDVSSSGNTININGYVCPVILPGESINYKYEYNTTTGFRNDGDNKVAVFAASSAGANNIYCLSDAMYFKLLSIYNNRPDNYGATTVQGSSTYGNLYYVVKANYSSSATLYVPYIGDFYTAMQNLNGNFDVSGNAGVDEDSFISDGDIDNSVLNPSQGYNTVINPGLTIPGLENGNVGTVRVKDYLDTLGQAINGIQNLTVAVQDLTTGIIDNVNVGAYDVTSDVALSNESEQDIENEVATPVLDVNEVPTQEAAQQALNGMQFDLTKIFPFCIPFDLVHLVQKFDVTPVAPHVQISVPLLGVGTDFELDIDLSDFDGVARVARMMELIASIVGLAMVTRGLIRG